MEKLNDGIIFAIISKGKSDTDIRLIDIDKEIFKPLADKLFQNTWQLTKNPTEFNGEYKPDYDESLMIKQYNIESELSEAINNPLGVETLSISNDEIDKIKAIFIVDYDDNNVEKIIFQKFKKTQYLKHNYLKIFWNKNTFDTILDPGINITDTIDCYFENNTLYFKSYYIANQILDLSDYYREATDTDLENFYNKNIIKIEDIESFKENANKWIRKKVATILDSEILDKYSIEAICKYAESINVHFDITDKKIIFPKENRKQRALLKMLCDEIYIGHFSSEIYETNSKKITQD